MRQIKAKAESCAPLVMYNRRLSTTSRGKSSHSADRPLQIWLSSQLNPFHHSQDKCVRRAPREGEGRSRRVQLKSVPNIIIQCADTFKPNVHGHLRLSGASARARRSPLPAGLLVGLTIYLGPRGRPQKPSILSITDFSEYWRACIRCNDGHNATLL